MSVFRETPGKGAGCSSLVTPSPAHRNNANPGGGVASLPGLREPSG